MRSIILALLVSFPATAFAYTDICERVDANTLKCTRLEKDKKPVQIVCKVYGLEVVCKEVK